MFSNTEWFKNFIIKAKTNTYANGSGRVFLQSPLPDSKILEFKQDELTYRDIYFGSMRFAGQETVYLKNKVIWSMNYAGQCEMAEHMNVIYGFLCKALMNISIEAPFRGPTDLSDESGLYYQNQFKGDINFFHGKETISKEGLVIYTLYYSCGWISSALHHDSSASSLSPVAGWLRRLPAVRCSMIICFYRKLHPQVKPRFP